MKKLYNSIKSIIHKFHIGIDRIKGESLPYVSNEKKYGNKKEIEVYNFLCTQLPEAKIYKSICIDKESAKGEIDILLIYASKVFVIEVKSWKGKIYQEDDVFYKVKQSINGEQYREQMKSPFKQIKRSTYLIKQEFKNIWFEPIVLFQDCDEIHITEHFVCFIHLVDMIYYIKEKGRNNSYADLQYMDNHLVSYDRLVSNKWFEKEQSCIIEESTLTFKIDSFFIEKKHIKYIKVEHYFSYDNLFITLKNNLIKQIKLDNHMISYRNNSFRNTISLSKVDYIFIG